MIKLALVLPCYNEHEVLPHSIERLEHLFSDLFSKQKITTDSYALFVNDGSRDNTWEIITQYHKEKPFVKGISLAANAGHQNAIMAGMMTAKDNCDAVITIDADLQDDLNAIEQMIDKFNEGNDIVYGVKVAREADPFMKRMTATMFYKLQHRMGIRAVYNHADFRLMSRRALNALAEYGERSLYLRGIIPLLGFKTATVDDVISERFAGQSKYTFCKILNLAMSGITSFSVKPMNIILAVGVVFLIVCLGILIDVIVNYCLGNVVPGWTSLMLSVWFVGGVILIALGVIGLYIGRIFTEVKRRPLYNIAEKLE